MVDVCSVSPVLTSGTHFLSISGNQHEAHTKDISTPADIAPSALETIILHCFMSYISALLLPSRAVNVGLCVLFLSLVHIMQTEMN